jgi:hypothetical protein
MKLAVVFLSGLLLTGCSTSGLSLQDQAKLAEYEHCLSLQYLWLENSTGVWLNNDNLREGVRLDPTTKKVTYQEIALEACLPYRP